LTPAEVVSVADGHGSEVLLRHVETCPTCRAQVDAVRAVEIDLRADSAVPEPSPLFWDHFSARVRQATSDEPVPASSWWPGRWMVVTAAGAAVIALAVMIAIRVPDRPVAPSMSDEARSAVSTPTPGADEGRWDDVVQMAAQLSSDDVSDLAVVADTTSLVDDLTSEQRQTLLRLLAVAMKDSQ
jgi:hypothetical protein